MIEQHNRRSSDNWTTRLQEIGKIVGILASLALGLIAYFQNRGQDTRLDNHKEAIIQNAEAVRAVGQVQSDVVGIPNVADAIIPVTPLEEKKP